MAKHPALSADTTDGALLDTPGDVLMSELVIRKKMSQDELARALGVSRVSVSQILHDRRNLTAEMALRLARVLGTSPEFWLDLQRDLDLHRARLKLGNELERLTPLDPPQNGPPLATREALFGPA